MRYFFEDLPDLAVVAAGSLIEFALADHTFSIPVGRIRYLHLGPLDFSEYLGAVDPQLQLFLSRWNPGDRVPESRHQQLLLRQREFMVVGGMPEAVQCWMETNLFSAVRQIQRSIVDTYIDDFAKYARQRQLVSLQRIFRAVPARIGRKVKYSQLVPEARSSEVRQGLDLLCKARVLTAVYHSDCSGLPLLAGQDDTTFKLLFLDAGLVSLMLGLDWSQVQQMATRELVNEGPLAEQFVGQQLLYRDNGLQAPQLHYWLREGRIGNAEVDFVISRGLSMVPVEVKAGKSGTLKSLQQFVLKTGAPQALRFDLNKPSRQSITTADASFELVSYPLYLAGRGVEPGPTHINAGKKSMNECHFRGHLGSNCMIL